ncbi:MAG: MBL fold metallo-hydrolase [Candidatus Aminicenantes bacterium]|nr:MBL fold metallo-hydrolase [Candidatus Aminicenantes bacterium]
MRKHKHKQFAVIFAAIFVLLNLSTALNSQEDVSFTLEKVSGEVYALIGPGGSIGIFKSKDALLVVDANYAKSAESIMAEIRKLSPLPIRYLINTHYHGDHTGGNAIIGKGAEIVSHTKCRESFLANQKPEESGEIPGAPQKIYETDMTLKIGEETVKLLYFGPGHTSGDTVVVFEKAKVIHAGDLFFHGLPPYIDVRDGSDTGNWVKTIGKLAEKYPDYKVIPGHGPVTTMPDFMEFADYLRYLRGGVEAAVKAGKTKEQTVDSIDLRSFDHIRDMGDFLTKKKNIEWIYDEMTRK